MTYEYMRNRFNEVKPIRGRSTDVRPIGDRRRDHELVCEISTPRAEKSYSAKLYRTHCVIFHPDNTVELQHGGWVSHSTADFINEHAPRTVRVFRASGVMWATLQHGRGEEGTYPVPSEGLILKPTNEIAWGSTCYVPVNPRPVSQRRINREEISKKRNEMRAFVDFGTALLKMSDGWLETPSDLHNEITSLTPMFYRGSATRSRDALEMIKANPDKWHLYMYAIGRMAPAKQWNQERVQFETTMVRDCIDDLIKKLPEVWRLIECKAGTRPTSNVVI